MWPVPRPLYSLSIPNRKEIEIEVGDRNSPTLAKLDVEASVIR
jgi:hypothetical protein